jgi:ADP-ribose pyrophosphatase YjhB (NUDIX family)
MAYAGIIPFSAAELVENSVKLPERGYPPIEHRLYLSPAVWNDMVHSDEITIPDGPWHITNHPNRQRSEAQNLLDGIATEESPMSAQQIAHWQSLGLLVDTAGRPLHPRASQLLTTQGVGMFTGPGFHYRYGPQRMGNLGLRRERNGIVEYAMSAVQRSTLKWGMPGGYAKAGEAVDAAAFREGYEEVGVEQRALGALSIRAAVLSPPKGFKRDTLHAWGEEWFTFVRSHDNPELDGIELITHDEQEVAEVAWVSVDDVRLSLQDRSSYDIIGTHAKIILKHEAELSGETL